MADPQPGPVPFDEAIRFFRAKANVKTDAWNSIDAQTHAVSFAVAGVRDMDALQSIRVAVDKAIADGTTLDEFRRDLKGVIERTGLALRGKFAWRSRVIFETNLRAAYASGKWAQIQATKQEFPLLRYVAVLDNRTRPQHRAWHGTILPVGHPFWTTHYPPNGWGCRCTVQQVSERDLKRRNWQVTDPAPSSGAAPRLVRDRNAPGGRRIVEVPPGIDEGWDHNVGEAEALARQVPTLPGWDKPLRPEQIGLPPEMPPIPMGAAVNRLGPIALDRARRAMEGLRGLRPEVAAQFGAALPDEITWLAEAEFRTWLAERVTARVLRGNQTFGLRSDGSARVVGTLLPQIVTWLAARPDLGQLPAGTIEMIAARMTHLTDPTRKAAKRLVLQEWMRLPSVLRAPEAALRDVHSGNLVYVFTPLDPAEARAGKIVIDIAFARRADAEQVVRPVVVSGGLVPRQTLGQRDDFEPIWPDGWKP